MDGQADGQTAAREKDRQTDAASRQRERQTDGRTGRRPHRQAASRQRERQTDRCSQQAERKIDTWTDRQTAHKTDSLADKQPGRQKERRPGRWSKGGRRGVQTGIS